MSDDDIVQRLRRIHGGSAVVEVTQEAADEIERLRAENALLRRVVVDLWDHMDEQSCIEFSAIRPRSYIVADKQWQADKRGGPS